MNIAQNVIERLGGAKIVANALQLDVSSVHRWKYSKDKAGCGGLVPTEHQAPLIRHARANGIQLNPEDFFPPDIRATESDRGELLDPSPAADETADRKAESHHSDPCPKAPENATGSGLAAAE